MSSGWKHTYNLNITEPGNAGLYSCNYYTGKTGRFVQSYESNRISIRVKDPPPKPTLSVDPPSGVVSEGHPLLITCTAPGNARQLRFHFYQDGAKIVPGDVGSEISTVEPRTGSMTVSELSIPQVDTNSTGEYTCRYEEKESGRWIMSTKSHAVTVTLKDPPPRPVLSMDPPSGVVNEGLPLLITCTAPGDASEWRFHFYKDGAKIVPGDAGSEISIKESSTSSRNVSVLSIPRAGPNSAGEFTCGYEENVNGKWVPSPRSWPVNVTVKDPLPLPVLSVDPPSGVVIKGVPLVITCKAPGDELACEHHHEGYLVSAHPPGGWVRWCCRGSGSAAASHLSLPEEEERFQVGVEEESPERWFYQQLLTYASNNDQPRHSLTAPSAPCLHVPCNIIGPMKICEAYHTHRAYPPKVSLTLAGTHQASSRKHPRQNGDVIVSLCLLQRYWDCLKGRKKFLFS
ncbi:basement membrane proteoglycan-like [Terrapene carolina triunguis]|uniref:basement membrane proteoglycan-like n=1 Tax=Terrapene triunguis TaxID=2587831 RepID=UPI0011560C4B|nr:basement membrane proteoglycan-like [Terrapene carolina triunguis]